MYKVSVNSFFNLFLFISPISVSLWQFYLIPILFIKKILKIDRIVVFFIFLMLPVIIYKLINLNTIQSIEYLRIYYSFIVFYLLFKNVYINFNIVSLILIFIHCCEVLFLILGISDKNTLFGFSTYGFTFFNYEISRPVGIFTNSTMSSAFYFIVFLLTKNTILKILMIICTLTFFSGTTFVIFALYGFRIKINIQSYFNSIINFNELYR